MALKSGTASKKILHNSFWFGLESVIESVVFLVSSIAVARYLGPAKLGYFSYINFFVTVVTRTSGTGLASATRKYMAEFLALGRPGVAHGVYRLAHRYQLAAALVVAGGGVAVVLLLGEPGYKLMASLLMLSLIPGIMSWVPAQANNAMEDTSDNTLSAFVYLGVYAVVIVLTIHFRWDLVGVASALLLARTAEVVVRTALIRPVLRAMPLEPLESDLIRRLRRYCLQAFGLQLLMSTVWDRSEMLVLRHFAPETQMGFYSVAYTLGVNLLLLPRILAGATGLTLMTEATRDRERIDGLVRNASRYLLLFSVPVCLGAAAVARSAVSVVYDRRYLGAVAAMMIGSVLVIPRAFQEIPETLLRAADAQDRILRWYVVTGVLNVAFDFLLIPRHGAAGAAWANGLAQAFGVAAVWAQARQVYRFHFPVAVAARMTVASLGMAAAAYFISHRIAGWSGLGLAILVASGLFLLLARLLRVLEPQDRQRLAPAGNRLPGPARKVWLGLISFITAPGAGA